MKSDLLLETILKWGRGEPRRTTVFTWHPSCRTRTLSLVQSRYPCARTETLYVPGRSHAAPIVMEQYGKRLAAAVRTLEGALEDSLAFYAFPREHWKMLRTNNPLERLMKEIRRRTKVAEQFPHEESALLLVTARLKRI